MSTSEHVPLREFIERILDERQDALKVTAESLEKRLTMLNELRGDVLTRTEYIPSHQVLIDRVERLEKWQAKSIGAALALMGMSGLLGALLGHYWK